MNNHNRAIVLFDEFPTPTFVEERESDYFIGVSTTYNLSAEDLIFQRCLGDFGLNNRSPLRNRQISNSRIGRIIQILLDEPVQLVIFSLDLSNEDLQRTVTLYRDLGDIIRGKQRQVGGRPIAHILRDQIISHCTFFSATNILEEHDDVSIINIFLDDWAIPESDVEISLENSSNSLQRRINELLKLRGDKRSVVIPPFSLLDEDNYRKRFIGVVTSVISRSFMNPNHPRFDRVPLDSLMEKPLNQYTDITDEVIDFLRDFMDEAVRNPLK